jgi:predicted MFS family arabinose efflux permease
LLSAFGAGAGSLSILIGAVSQRLAPEQRSFAAGFVNAGGSLGQFVFAPLVQMAIVGFGWANAMFALAAAMLTTLPLAWPLRRRDRPAPPASVGTPASEAGTGLWRQLAMAARDRSYWWLNLGFFTCGFHVAFLVTHLPGEVRLCGLSPSIAANSLAIIGIANIAGSLGAGWLGNRYRMKHLLFWIYLLRAAAVLAYLAAPKSATTFYIFAVALGLTWLATLPPTAGIVGKLFGVRYLATLLGVSLAVHQIGGFYGAWLGGIAVANLGDYNWMWYADALLATLAALSNLPIREAPAVRIPIPA